MDRNQFCHNKALNEETLLSAYQNLVEWIDDRSYDKIEETLFELQLNYNHTNSYGLKALVGEITVKMPNDTLGYFADFFHRKLHISSTEIEYYLENRIHMIMEKNHHSWGLNTDMMLKDQARDILKNALNLDSNFLQAANDIAANSNIPNNNYRWADQVIQ